MSEQNKPSGNMIHDNVIQFPGSKREEAKAPPKPPVNSPKRNPAPKSQKTQAPKKSKLPLAGGVLAIALATSAVNRYALEERVESFDFSSNVANRTRSIASVERANWKRDAAWEMDLSERLASAQVRDVASTGIGHTASPEEKLRWGTLEEKYTIVYKPGIHEIQTIILQDPATNPSYVLDRNKFLHEYGALLDGKFASAKLKSVEVSHDKTVEFYTIFDKDLRPQREARFELDVHKRLLSLKMEPAEI